MALFADKSQLDKRAWAGKVKTNEVARQIYRKILPALCTCNVRCFIASTRSLLVMSFAEVTDYPKQTLAAMMLRRFEWLTRNVEHVTEFTLILWPMRSGR